MKTMKKEPDANLKEKSDIKEYRDFLSLLYGPLNLPPPSPPCYVPLLH
jgi:hypothetical protein